MELLITFLAGFSIMAGVFAVLMKSVNEERVEHFSVAMAMASLLALLAFDLGPEVFESAKENNWIDCGNGRGWFCWTCYSGWLRTRA